MSEKEKSALAAAAGSANGLLDKAGESFVLATTAAFLAGVEAERQRATTAEAQPR